MRTTVFDAKDTTIPGTEVRPDGTRHLNLDRLFDGHLEQQTNSIDGYPAATVSVRSFSRMKLAANRRLHRGVALHDYYSFGGWDDQNFGRIDDGGPMVRGPHMYAFQLGLTLTDQPQPDEVALLVEDGDTVQFLGSEFRVTFPAHANRNMQLELVAEAVSA